MIRGQRFELNLDDDEDNNDGQTAQAQQRMPSAFVSDVLERSTPIAAKPPTMPSMKTRSTGFPEHTRRKTPITSSRFKQQKQHQESAISPAASKTLTERDTVEMDDRARIDAENQAKLDSMTPAQIEEERRELMDSLSPAFLQKLLLRANIDSGSAETDLEREEAPEEKREENKTRPAKSVSFAAENIAHEDEQVEATEPHYDEDIDSGLPPSDDTTLPSIHFPKPTQPPDLDPSSATFLDDLHTKYFPSLPSDPSKLSWMQPATAAENAAYAPDAPALAAADIRFDFRGALIPPRKAAAIPVTAGLHHHAAAPDAAGYTIAELAHLARSTVAAQRCIAFQTLGRILFRLGRGEFGNPSAENVTPSSLPSPADGEDGDEVAQEAQTGGFSELAQGLWREVDRCQIITFLVDESEGRGVDGGRHLSAKTYATEAVWLWRKGGGRRWKAD